MMEMIEIKKLSDADLNDRIAAEREALAKIRFNHTVAGLESPMIIRNKKRDIARLLTELNTRQNASS
jgi:large subunit ribosomal protein L29